MAPCASDSVVKVHDPNDPHLMSVLNLNSLKKSIPNEAFEKSLPRSLFYLFFDYGMWLGAVYAINTLCNSAVWGQMDTWQQYAATLAFWNVSGFFMWGIFVVGHDCGHQSFSANKTMNDFVGNITHASILVPYHGWRISHRTHHSNHGHVENDESWHPVAKHLYEKMDGWGKAGRLSLPWAMLAYPFYLMKRSPGKTG